MTQQPVRDDLQIIRRVAAEQIQRDRRTGRCRPATNNLTVGEYLGAASCRIAGEADLQEIASEGSEEYMYALVVAAIRAAGLDVVRTPEEGGPGHCNITGARNATRPRLRALLSQAIWVRGYLSLIHI